MLSGSFEFELYRYCVDPRETQIACGVPTFAICDLKAPSPSKTWMRLLPASATYRLPAASLASPRIWLNCPCADPVCPHDFRKSPSLVNFAIRLLPPYPSAT